VAAGVVDDVGDEAGDGLEPPGGVIGEGRGDGADRVAVRVGLAQDAAALVEGHGEAVVDGSDRIGLPDLPALVVEVVDDDGRAVAGRGLVADVVVAGAGLVVCIGGGVGLRRAVFRGLREHAAEGIVGEVGDLALGVGLVREAAGVVVDIGPAAEVRIGHREAAAEGIVRVGPVVAGVVGEAGEAVEQVVLRWSPIVGQLSGRVKVVSCGEST